MELKEKITKKITKEVKNQKKIRIIFFSAFSLTIGFVFWMAVGLSFEANTLTRMFSTPEFTSIMLYVLMIPSLCMGMLFSTWMLVVQGGYKWYYDEFEIHTSIMPSFKKIKILPVNKVEDIGNKYKINVTTYALTGVRGNKDFVVDKWKVRIDNRWEF